MKIWKGYGSEHSMSLVMIGHFKDASDAKETKEVIDYLSAELPKHIEIETNSNRFSKDVLRILEKYESFVFRPWELENFLYDIQTEVKGDKIILKTDETEVSAFFKLMVDKGAKVEVFSTHDYPEEERAHDK